MSVKKVNIALLIAMIALAFFILMPVVSADDRELDDVEESDTETTETDEASESEATDSDGGSDRTDEASESDRGGSGGGAEETETTEVEIVEEESEEEVIDAPVDEEEEVTIDAPVPARGDYYRHAKWKCTGERDSQEFGDRTSCKTTETWKIHAERHCRDACEGTEGRCGVEVFNVTAPCRLDATIEAPTIAVDTPAGCYRGAKWKCVGDVEESGGDETSCKPVRVWKRYAVDSCGGERGLVSFYTYDPCSCAEESIIIEEETVDTEIEEEMTEEAITSLDEHPRLLGKFWNKIKLMQKRLDKQAKRLNELEKRIRRLEAMIFSVTEEEEETPREEREMDVFGELAVKVVDFEGEPASGAEVTVAPVAPGQAREFYRELTNGEGLAYFKLPYGKYLVRGEYSREGIYLHSGRNPIVMDEQEEGISVRLNPMGGTTTIATARAAIDSVRTTDEGRAEAEVDGIKVVAPNLRVKNQRLFWARGTGEQERQVENPKRVIIKYLMEKRGWTEAQALEHLEKLRNTRVEIAEDGVTVEYERPNETPILNWIIPKEKIREKLSQAMAQELVGESNPQPAPSPGEEVGESNPQPAPSPGDLVGESNPQPAPGPRRKPLPRDLVGESNPQPAP